PVSLPLLVFIYMVQFHTVLELPQHKRADVVRWGLSTVFFGCTIGGSVAVEDELDVVGLTGRAAAILLGERPFLLQCLRRAISIGRFLAVKVLLPLIFVPV